MIKVFDRDLSKDVVKLAIPVVISQVSQTVVGLVDTMMVGRISVDALAATGLAGIAVWMIIGAIGHVSSGVQIIVSRRFGEQRFAKAGTALVSGFRLSIIISLLF